MKSSEIKKLVDFFYEIGNLRKVLRAHQQALLTSDLTNNVASHFFRTAFIGYFLAKQLKVDADKVIKMCLLHDLEEFRSGDQNWLHLEAKIAKDADLLDEIFLLKEYE